MQGDLLIVFVDSKCAINLEVQRRVERRAVNLPGGCDLKMAFAPSASHSALHERLSIIELPAVVFLKDGVEKERCSSIDDVLEFVSEIVLRYK